MRAATMTVTVGQWSGGSRREVLFRCPRLLPQPPSADVGKSSSIPGFDSNCDYRCRTGHTPRYRRTGSSRTRPTTPINDSPPLPLANPATTAPLPKTKRRNSNSTDRALTARSVPSMLPSIARIHWRHGCPICLVAPRSQAPKPHRGAPKARDLTAKARTELPSIRRKTNSRRILPGLLVR